MQFFKVLGGANGGAMVTVQGHVEVVQKEGQERATEDLAVPEWMFKQELASNKVVQVMYLREILDLRMNIT